MSEGTLNRPGDETLILAPETITLLEADEPVMASICLQQLTAQCYEWLDIRLAGGAGSFKVTCRFSGVGDPQPGPKAAYDHSVVRARAWCHGFVAGWTCRKH